MSDHAGHPGLHLPLVRRPPAPQLRHRRDPRRWTPRRGWSTRSAIAALIQAMVKELAEHYDAGKSLSRYPYEMLDENKWLAARHGLEGELVDLPATDRVEPPGAGPAADGSAAPARRGARLRGRVRRAARTSSTTAPGAARQALVYEANHDLREVVREIVDATRARGGRDPRPTDPCRAGYSESYVSQPDLFVVCRNCGSEVSPYVTECPYCGQRVRKRAPKLDRVGRREPAQAPPAAPAADAAAPAARGDRGHRARHAALRHVRA